MAIDNFIPQIWSGRILENLDKAHVFAARLNRDYEGEIKNFPLWISRSVECNWVNRRFTLGSVPDTVIKSGCVLST